MLLARYAGAVGQEHGVAIGGLLIAVSSAVLLGIVGWAVVEIRADGKARKAAAAAPSDEGLIELTTVVAGEGDAEPGGAMAAGASPTASGGGGASPASTGGPPASAASGGGGASPASAGGPPASAAWDLFMCVTENNEAPPPAPPATPPTLDAAIAAELAELRADNARLTEENTENAELRADNARLTEENTRLLGE